MSKSSKSGFRDVECGNPIPERYTDEPVIPLLNDYDTRDAPPPFDNYDTHDAPPPFTTYIPVVKKLKTGFGMSDTLTVSHDPHLNNDGEALYRYNHILHGEFFSLDDINVFA